jgi:hypothetical protein
MRLDEKAAKPKSEGPKEILFEAKMARARSRKRDNALATKTP